MSTPVNNFPPVDIQEPECNSPTDCHEITGQFQPVTDDAQENPGSSAHKKPKENTSRLYHLPQPSRLETSSTRQSIEKGPTSTQVIVHRNPKSGPDAVIVLKEEKVGFSPFPPDVIFVIVCAPSGKHFSRFPQIHIPTVSNSYIS